MPCSRVNLTTLPQCSVKVSSLETCSKIPSILSVSTVSGSSPIKPKITALPVPWPLPVWPREPKSSALNSSIWVTSPESVRFCIKILPAFIGPTVCELDGPMPILNMSNTLIMIEVLLCLVYYFSLSAWDCSLCRLKHANLARVLWSVAAFFHANHAKSACVIL